MRNSPSMMMALGLRLTAKPRCTLGCMIDGEKEGKEEQSNRRREQRESWQGTLRREGGTNLKRLSENGDGGEGGEESEEGMMVDGWRRLKSVVDWSDRLDSAGLVKPLL